MKFFLSTQKTVIYLEKSNNETQVFPGPVATLFVLKNPFKYLNYNTNLLQLLLK